MSFTDKQIENALDTGVIEYFQCETGGTRNIQVPCITGSYEVRYITEDVLKMVVEKLVKELRVAEKSDPSKYGFSGSKDESSKVLDNDKTIVDKENKKPKNSSSKEEINNSKEEINKLKEEIKVLKEGKKEEAKSDRSLERRLKTAKDTIRKFESKTEENHETIRGLKQEIKDFESTYGKFTNPYMILRQIYNGGDFGEFHMCITYANIKSKPPKRGYDFWMQVFKTLNIIRETKKGVFQCATSYAEANNILYAENPSFKNE